jgi:nicotinamide phosphoribosyltransferase
LDVDYAEQRVNMHGLPFDREGWDIIVNEYKGHLPIMIEAIDEGSVVPLGTPLVQVRNTDPRFPWLPAFIETAMHRAIWYPTTVATLSREAKKIIYRGLQESSDDRMDRFCSSFMTLVDVVCLPVKVPCWVGMAHLVNFMGTDTVEALEGAYAFYGDEMAGFFDPCI